MRCSANNDFNNRSHRKILVIDGKVGYTGGVNIADEYINIGSKFGHWKDNCIRVEGDAVWNYTVMFLTLWNSVTHEDNDYNKATEIIEHSGLKKKWKYIIVDEYQDTSYSRYNLIKNIKN